jgi:PadR family transcriptional regulator, regulatory protein AphA
MSLRHALLNLLAGEPRSGYDLAGLFSISMGNVWPAQHSQIYPELAKLLADGLIEQTGEGPRGRRTYQTTPEGLDELRSWLRDTEPDYSIRHPALLRAFCLWALPKQEALELLARDRAEYVRQLTEIDHALANVDWSANELQRASRLVIECGQRFYRLQLDWIDWAAGQIAAGALQPGNPPPS